MRRKGFTSKNGRSSDGGRGGLTRLSNQRLYSPQMEWHGPERDQRGSQTNLGSSAISALPVTFAVYCIGMFIRLFVRLPFHPRTTVSGFSRQFLSTFLSR